MLTLLDINRAMDRLGGAAFVPRTRRGRLSRTHDTDAAIEVVTERILPSHLDALRSNGHAMLPEHRLMLAVLKDAVHTYQRAFGLPDVRNQRIVRETDRWLASDEATSPFSFVTICHAFGLDPASVRARLRRWSASRGPVARATTFNVRRVSGSRHQVTVAK